MSVSGYPSDPSDANYYITTQLDPRLTNAKVLISGSGTQVAISGSNVLVNSMASGVPATVPSAGQILQGNGSAYAPVDNTQTISFPFETIALNATKEWIAPFDGQIVGAFLTTSGSGVASTCTVDVRKMTSLSTFSSPVSITASATPQILAATSTYSDTTLTGWTTTFSSGNILQAKVTAVSVLTSVQLHLKIKRTS